MGFKCNLTCLCHFHFHCSLGRKCASTGRVLLCDIPWQWTFRSYSVGWGPATGQGQIVAAGLELIRLWKTRVWGQLGSLNSEVCWSLLISADHCWSLLITPDHCWSLLIIADHCWSLLISADQCYKQCDQIASLRVRVPCQARGRRPRDGGQEEWLPRGDGQLSTLTLKII